VNIIYRVRFNEKLVTIGICFIFKFRIKILKVKPISLDMITRIRNASIIKESTVNILCSKMTLKIAEILKNEGFIESFDLKSKEKKIFISIKLKYKGLQQHPYIANLYRVSKPGLRVYTKSSLIPKVFGGIGIAIYSL
jgi:small subunit ribosomal protein S8